MKNWLLRLVMAVALVMGQLAPVSAQASDVVKSGEIDTLNESVTLVNINGRPGVAVVIGGTFSATLTPQVSVDNSTWETTDFYDLSAKARAATTTASGSYIINGATGMAGARITATAYTSGTVEITLRAGAGPLSLPADVMSSAPAGTENGLVVRTITGTGTSATQVQGTAASGSAIVGNPVPIAGAQNGTNVLQTVQVSPRGVVAVAIDASSSVIGTVAQGASTSLPWTAMLTNGSGVQQGTSTNPLAIVGQATGSIGSANLAAIGAVNSAGNVVAPRTGLDNSLFVTLQASGSTIGNVGIVSGSAEIGQVAQGTATASAGAWPVKLTDGTDTAMLDGNGYLGVIQGTATVSAGAWPMKLTDGTDTASVDVNGYVGVTQGTATASAGAWPVKITDGTDTAQVDGNGYQIISQGTATASAGAWVVIGTSTGSVGSASGLLTTGRDSAGAAQPIKVDTTGAPQVDIESGPTGASALQAQGAAASGSAATGNPMLVGGQQSGTNGVQTLHVGPAGDLFVTLQASTSAIGKLAANSGVDIGDVDILSIAAGDTNIGNVDVASMPADATELPAAAALQDGATNPTSPMVGASVQVFNGTTWDRARGNASGQMVVAQGAATASTDPWVVIGTSTGSVGSANGLLATGRDSAGNAQPIRMATDGTVRTDPTGTTTQPVSGTVTANAGTGTFTVDGSGVTQPVSGTFWQATQPVSGTVTANIGASTSLPVLITQTSPDGTRVTEDWRTPSVSVISVGTSATQLIPSSPAKMVGACFQPLDGVIYVAESTISSAVTYPGLRLAQYDIFCPDMYTGGAWYAIATPSAVTTAVMTSVSAQ